MMTSVKIQVVMASVAVSIALSCWRMGFELWHFALPGAAVALAFSFCALIHNASHGSLRPRWLNRPVGELMGLFQLSGFPDWQITHVLHHTYTDDPVLDPHPPLNKGYWEFTTGMRASVVSAYLESFFRYFPRNQESMAAVRMFARYSKLSHALKMILMFVILGPVLFSWFFVPSIAAKMLQFSWLNWAGHRRHDGAQGAQDLEHGWYRVANFFSFGLYAHDSHHRAPALFDPRSLKHRTNEKNESLAKSA